MSHVVSIDEMQKQNEIIGQIFNINEQRRFETNRQQRFMLITYGCLQNTSDSEKIKGYLSKMGFVECEHATEADLILFNTCAVRENAEKRIYGNIGALKSLKIKNSNLLIGICGCMAQLDYVVEKIQKSYKNVDFMFGTNSLYKLPEIVYTILMERKSIFEKQDDIEILEELPVVRESAHKANVTIMYGCNNFCSYCIVPYTRGRERSRKPEDIMKEIKMLSEEGYKEIVLLGQNVNSYGKDLEETLKFHNLLAEIAKIQGIERIRFLTSHPKDISDELLVVMSQNDQICNHLHLPFQSGSDRILKAMNRRYTKDEYLNIVEKARTLMPDISFTSDVIIGFPFEDDEDFNDTIDLIKKVRFDLLFTFKYSKRKGTLSYDLDDQIPDDIKDERFEKLLEIQNKISKEINDMYVGKTFEVLVDGVSKTNSAVFTGRTFSNKVVNFSGDNLKTGQMVDVFIKSAQTWSLLGEIKNQNTED